MKISTKGRYALRMMVDLAEHQNGEYISLKDIAQRQEVSKKYLEQIVPILNKSGFLKTNRGYQGGYMLAKPPRAVHRRRHPAPDGGGPCARSVRGAGPGRLPRSEDCATLPVWRGLNRVINEYLDGITLQDLLDQQRAHYANDYMI